MFRKELRESMNDFLSKFQGLIREQFQIEGSLAFESLSGGIVNAPVLAYHITKDSRIPFAVFKYVKNKDHTFALKQIQALVEMRSGGFEHLPHFLKNKNGEYLTSFGDATFYCIEYVPPDPDQKLQQQNYSLEELLALTAQFHMFSKHNSLANELPKSKHGRYLTRVCYFSDMDLFKWDRSTFDTDIWKNVVRLGEYFASSDFEAIYDSLPLLLIHGDNAPTNLVFSKRKPYFIDLDAVRTDCRLMDFAVCLGWNYLTRYLELLENRQLVPLIQTHYGNLEEIEKEYFHTIVTFRKFDFLAWALEKLKQYLREENQEKVTQFRRILLRTLAELHKMPMV